MTNEIAIRSVTAADAPAIAGIYNHYVRNSVVTFEEEDVAPSAMAERIRVASASLPWLVAERGGVVCAYAYARKYHERAAYRHTVEAAAYCDHALLRQGVGSRLYEKLLATLPGAGVHVAIGSIAIPNPESIALHEKFGFKKVGELPQLGFKFGRWIDVGLWQLMFA
jgi:phosphinothricin acetyltransferase